jgi:hypothetical protein
MIEKLPFFERYYEHGKAIVDVALLEKWLNETATFEVMTEQDEMDRQAALDELEAGECADLPKAMESW